MGGTEEGSKEESDKEEGDAKGLHGWYVPCACCRLGYRHQQSICDVYVMHMEVWGVAEGVKEEGMAEGLHG